MGAEGREGAISISCSWRRGLIPNPGYPPSLKNYLNYRTWSCPSADCLRTAARDKKSEEAGLPSPSEWSSRIGEKGAPAPRGRVSRAEGQESRAESVAPLVPGPRPALTVHAGEGQRLRPELLLHRDLQVKLDVVHAGDDFLHGGGGGPPARLPLRSLAALTPLPAAGPTAQGPCPPRLDSPCLAAVAAAPAAARGLPGAPGACEALLLPDWTNRARRMGRSGRPG